MMKFELEKLVISLSVTEKKNFKAYCNLSGNSNKDYFTLFELLCSSVSGNELSAEEEFKKKYPSKSYENTAAYLFKVLTDMLVQFRVEQDKWFIRHHALMKARLCFERSLPDRAMKEIKKAQKLAIESQDNATYYMASRMELSHITDTGFKHINEQELVDMQMKAKHTLQTLRQVHEHYSLYELLSYRLTLPELTFKSNDKKKLNDLVLSELSITTRGSQHQFESKKLHLLFQSFFFIHTGDYQSALKIFKQLNELIEDNEPLWVYPPYDYLTTLDGFLDSLRSIRYYKEMDYFIEKTEHLTHRQYPEHFSMMARQTIYLYRLNMLIGSGDSLGAVKFFESVKQDFSLKAGTTNYEKYLELLLSVSIAYFNIGKWQKANKYSLHTIDAEKDYKESIIYRACRLFHILIHCELDSVAYLQYDIRAYKRAFSKNGKLFATEKMIFNVVALDLKRSSVVKKKLAWKKLEPQVINATNNKHEQQLLKFYNFCNWIKKSMT